MDNGNLNWIVNFIWGIADDVLRDLYVRGKYRDVILPMTVLRRLDAVLEPTKQAVLAMHATLDREGIVHQDQALRQVAGQAFYKRTFRVSTRTTALRQRGPEPAISPHSVRCWRAPSYLRRVRMRRTPRSYVK
jgi:type I restriction-modification system DNA methylase subunit